MNPLIPASIWTPCDSATNAMLKSISSTSSSSSSAAFFASVSATAPSVNVNTKTGSSKMAYEGADSPISHDRARTFGVYYALRRKFWNAQYKPPGAKRKAIGSYPSKIMGMLAHDKKVREIFGDEGGTGINTLHYTKAEYEDILAELGGKIISIKMLNAHKKSGSSKYNGVYLSCGKWKAQMKVNGENIHLSYSDSEIECAEAYDAYIREHKMRNYYHKINFPTGGHDEPDDLEQPAYAAYLDNEDRLSDLHKEAGDLADDFDGFRCQYPRHQKILMIIAFAIAIIRHRRKEQKMLQDEWSDPSRAKASGGSSNSSSSSSSSSSNSTGLKRNRDIISKADPSRSKILSGDKVANLLSEFFSLTNDRDRGKFAENLYGRWEAVMNRTTFERTFEKLFERLKSIIGKTGEGDEDYMIKILEFVRHLTHFRPLKCSVEFAATFKKYLIRKLGLVLKHFTAMEFDMRNPFLWGDVYDGLGKVTRIFSESAHFLCSYNTPDTSSAETRQWIRTEILDINSTAKSFPLVTNAFVTILKTI